MANYMRWALWEIWLVALTGAMGPRSSHTHRLIMECCTRRNGSTPWLKWHFDVYDTTQSRFRSSFIIFDDDLSHLSQDRCSVWFLVR